MMVLKIKSHHHNNHSLQAINNWKLLTFWNVTWSTETPSLSKHCQDHSYRNDQLRIWKREFRKIKPNVFIAMTFLLTIASHTSTVISILTLQTHSSSFGLNKQRNWSVLQKFLVLQGTLVKCWHFEKLWKIDNWRHFNLQFSNIFTSFSHVFIRAQAPERVPLLDEFETDDDRILSKTKWFCLTRSKILRLFQR